YVVICACSAVHDCLFVWRFWSVDLPDVLLFVAVAAQGLIAHSEVEYDGANLFLRTIGIRREFQLTCFL
ncbi:MAG: hypothetical protein RIQ50_254, partial [Bacteroidota bacterium]